MRMTDKYVMSDTKLSIGESNTTLGIFENVFA